MQSVEDRAIEWLGNGRVGLSSQSIAMHMLGKRSEGNYPHDPDDLSRCLLLLQLIPEWAPRIGEMARYGQGWIGLVDRWAEITASMIDEAGIDWSKARSATKTYALMRAAIDDGLKRDPNLECKTRPDGTVYAWSSKRPAA